MTVFHSNVLPRTRYLTDDEVRRLLNGTLWLGWAKNRAKYRVLFALLVDRGPRITEALRLRVSDLDPASQAITVRTLKKRHNSPVMRTVPLSPEVFTALVEYCQRKQLGPGDLIFDGTNRKVAWRNFKKVLCHAKLPLQHRPHDLRHTAGTRLGHYTRDPFLIRDVLGHANISTTNIYVATVELAEKLSKVKPIG